MQRKPDRNIAWNPRQQLTVVNALMLASVRAHAEYWSVNPHAESALGCTVSTLFGHAGAVR